MFQLREFHEVLLTHLLTPAGPIPTVYDPEGVYPYPSFVESSHRPLLKAHRFVSLENDTLRVTVCPDLGGKVHSIIDKRSGQEVLYVPESVLPLRILPRMAFIPGGIEVSFPISHSPVQLEPVEFRSEQIEDRLYVWCGERELHTGMRWTVEYSLGQADTFLTQRTCFHNPTSTAHPWMSWSNAALPARPDSEFHFPGGPVLTHGAELRTIDWLSQGPRRMSELDRMTGFFWLEPEHGVCGVFTPSLGQGLYHLADSRSAPGMKLWSYGVGRDEPWGRAGSFGTQSYIEVQGGPIRDQSIRKPLPPGATHTHVEYWLPSSTSCSLADLRVPSPRLVSASRIPWFDWPSRPAARYWQDVLSAEASPVPPGPGEDLWPPNAMEGLGERLRQLVSTTQGEVQDSWRFQLGAWLAGGGQVTASLEALAQSRDDRSRILAARIFRKARNSPREAVHELGAITNSALAMHPQITVERDLALAALGPSSIPEREKWLTACWNSPDEWVRERIAALLVDEGKPAEARAILETTCFQRVHQRYERTELWRRIAQGAGGELPGPAFLGEDDLARFGAYRQTE